MKGIVPMTKIEAFRLAAAEIGSVSSEEMSTFIQNKFGIVIAPPYIPLFQATLRFQNRGPAPEKSMESSYHAKAEQ